MHPAALPAGAEHPPDRRFEPLMGIGDHQLDPAHAAPCETLQKTRPKGLGLRGADVQPDDLASAVAIGRHRNYRGDRDKAAALALLQVRWRRAYDWDPGKSLPKIIDEVPLSRACWTRPR